MLIESGTYHLTVLYQSSAQRRGGKPPPPRKEAVVDDDRARHEKDFIAFDLNSDNYVDASEIRQVSPNLKPEELSGFYITADKNEDGLITLEEYITASMELEQQ